MALGISPGLLKGTVTAPPSKSLAHRAVLCAALAEGTSEIKNITPSQDISATTEAVKSLGAVVKWDKDCMQITGIGGKSPAGTQPVIDCGESGSTLRFFLPIALACAQGGTLTGAKRLAERPMEPYRDICEEQGILYQDNSGANLQLAVKGALTSGTFTLPGDISSQFITGLLYALPLLKEDSVIELSTPLQSAGYIDLTTDMLAQFGIVVKREGTSRFIIPGNQQYKSYDCAVEGDFSQAAVFLCADALGSQVKLTGMRQDSLQGDKAVLDILCAMGATPRWDGDTLWVEAPQTLHASRIDISQCPDIAPAVAVVAALCEGESEIVGAGRLRIKESDRLAVICDRLNQMGAKIEEQEDSMRITGVSNLNGGTTFDCANDHRIAMMAALAATVCKQPVTISDPACVAKSYPNFFEHFTQLGGNTNER